MPDVFHQISNKHYVTYENTHIKENFINFYLVFSEGSEYTLLLVFKFFTQKIHLKQPIHKEKLKERRQNPLENNYLDVY